MPWPQNARLLGAGRRLVWLVPTAVSGSAGAVYSGWALLVEIAR